MNTVVESRTPTRKRKLIPTELADIGIGTGRDRVVMEDLPSFASCLRGLESRSNDFGTDKNTIHAYGPLYEEELGSMRKSATSILEVGIHSGASLCAFAKYFPYASVTGVDITLKKVKFGRDDPRIEMHRCDATNDTELNEALGARKFDVIVDDGSHQPSHQLCSLELLAPRLSPRGVYLIEDINGKLGAGKLTALRRDIASVGERHGMVTSWHDLRSEKGRFDDIVAILRKTVL